MGLVRWGQAGGVSQVGLGRWGEAGGAGQVGQGIAQHLAGEGIDVIVVDRAAALMQRISDTLDVRPVQGHGAYPEVLEKAGAADADILIAVTASDEVNMVTCQVAKSIFNVPKTIDRVRARQAALFEKTKGDKAGISPHAPYTTSPELWRSLKRAPTLCNLPFSMHLSESIEEYDLFKHRKGPMYEWFNSIKHLPEWGTGSPIQLMDQAGILKKNGIAVHVNCLDEGDIERLVQKNIRIFCSY